MKCASPLFQLQSQGYHASDIILRNMRYRPQPARKGNGPSRPSQILLISRPAMPRAMGLSQGMMRERMRYSSLVMGKTPPTPCFDGRTHHPPPCRTDIDEHYTRARSSRATKRAQVTRKDLRKVLSLQRTTVHVPQHVPCRGVYQIQRRGYYIETARGSTNISAMADVKNCMCTSSNTPSRVWERVGLALWGRQRN